MWVWRTSRDIELFCWLTTPFTLVRRLLFELPTQPFAVASNIFPRTFYMDVMPSTSDRMSGSSGTSIVEEQDEGDTRKENNDHPRRHCQEATLAFSANENEQQLSMTRATTSQRDIKSRMMKNMLSGQATSLSECILVVIAGQLLAFNSGFTNGACLSGFLLPSGRRQGVSAFTGAYTGSALDLADGHTDRFGFQVSMILSFIFGASLAGLLTPKAVQYRIEPTYCPTFLIGGLVLLAASIMAAVDHSNNIDDFVFYLVAVANGLQNGLSSLYSGNLIRSTHFTGISTDIGLFTGQLLRGNYTNNWKLAVFVALAVSFWLGGFASFYATQHFMSSTLLFNASLFLAVGAVLLLFLMHEHSIPFLKVLLGTWHWKRALTALSEHHLEPLSNGQFSLGQRERLDHLFTTLDVNESGTITPDELLDGLRNAGFTVTMREIKIMIRFADKDRNGVISQEEWRQMLEEIYN